jgi:hypothetical protein
MTKKFTPKELERIEEIGAAIDAARMALAEKSITMQDAADAISAVSRSMTKVLDDSVS